MISGVGILIALLNENHVLHTLPPIRGMFLTFTFTHLLQDQICMALFIRSKDFKAVTVHHVLGLLGHGMVLVTEKCTLIPAYYQLLELCNIMKYSKQYLYDYGLKNTKIYLYNSILMLFVFLGFRFAWVLYILWHSFHIREQVFPELGVVLWALSMLFGVYQVIVFFPSFLCFRDEPMCAF